MANKFARKKSEVKTVAEQRIRALFREAALTRNTNLSNRYVAIARKISSKLKVSIPKELKRRFCKHCGNYLKPGLNARIRLNKGKKTYFCMKCNTLTRVPYK